MTQTSPHTPAGARSIDFASRTGARYWWHQFGQRRYTPPLYSDLSEEEWGLLAAWFEETDRDGSGGEMAVPMMSVLQAFVMGSGVRSVVQLGHYKGYSTLLLGFMLRRMGAENGLVSIDTNEQATEYTRGWVERAGLSSYVTLLVNDSAAPAMPTAAAAVLGRSPRCVIVDSSHRYAHTLRELDLWWGALAPGGLMFLHDCSEHARQWDRSGEGGVRRALHEWLPRHPEAGSIMLEGSPHADDASAYADGCGLCIVQKPLASGPGR